MEEAGKLQSESVAEATLKSEAVVTPPYPESDAPPPSPPPPASDPVVTGFALTELQHQAVQTQLWKKRALKYRAQETEGMLRQHVEESRQADVEFLRICKGVGIDVKRNFQITPKGVVEYEGAGSPRAANPGKTSK